MPWESDEKDVEVKDRTAWWWYGIAVIFMAMVALTWIYGRPKSSQSQVRVKHILVAFNKANPADEARAGKLIREIRERLVKGESFSKLAEQYSNDPSSATRGGDLGYMARGSFVDAFEKYAWEGNIGELSDVVQTQFGYHLIKVEDRIISDVEKAKAEEDERIKKKAAEEQKKQQEQPKPPETTQPQTLQPQTPVAAPAH